MNLRSAAVAYLLFTQIGCPKSQQSDAGRVSPCSLAMFLFDNFPAYRELSCSSDAGMCVLGYRAVDHETPIDCGGRQFMRLDAVGRDAPCVAPLFGVDETSGEWVLMLDNVGFRRSDGGITFQSHMLESYEGRGQLSSSDLPMLSPDDVAEDKYLRRALLNGVRQCLAGVSPLEDVHPRPNDGGLGRREESRQEMLIRMKRAMRDGRL